MQGSIGTGTYAINGINFLTEPSDGRWLARKVLGYDGAGHPVYPATREYQLDWDIADETLFNQLLGFYNGVSVTGTVVVDLPQFNRVDYFYLSYSGVTLSEPEMSNPFFVGFPMKIRLVIQKIITGNT